MKKIILPVVLSYMFSVATSTAQVNTGSSLFSYKKGWKTRWSSGENMNGVKGRGGLENNGAKGHPFDTIGAGQSLTLLDIEGMGIIQRIWITNSAQSGQMLRALKIEIFWDHEEKPAVSAPIGDFFGGGLGRKVPFENALFADPVFFSSGCKVTIQQLGGTMSEIVAGYQDKNIPVIPVGYDNGTGGVIGIYKKDSIEPVDTIAFAKSWINFYRKEDISAVSYFYLKSPVNNLPGLQPVLIRTYGMKE